MYSNNLIFRFLQAPLLKIENNIVIHDVHISAGCVAYVVSHKETAKK